jgi:choline dehydrogenase-like flavoprotein
MIEWLAQQATSAAASKRPTSQQAMRTWVAFAEAVIPGSASIRGGDERLVRRTLEVLDMVHPAGAAALTAAMRALSLAAFARKGKPFESLSLVEQEALFDAWLDDPVLRGPAQLVAFLFKFVHFDKGSAYRDRPSLPVVTQLESPPWLSQIVRADDWTEGDELECDVVVVGTGAGGAVVGRELADRGLAVVFVEEGEHHRRDAMTNSSIEAHRKFYRGGVTVGNAVIPVFIGRMVGGSTAVNTGSSYRTPPWVLDEWCERIGTTDFSPEAMRPFFDRVETILEVGAPERKHIGPIADVVARGADKLGWHHGPVRRNAVGCEGAGFCDFGCATDARKSTNLSYIPPALSKGALLLTALKAERVWLEGGRAVGIHAVSKGGRSMRVRARAVVLSAGALPTPLFLQRQGLCGRSGELGKNLTLHPSAGISGLFDEPIRGARHIPQGYNTEQFLRDGLLIAAAQADENFSGIVFPYVGRRLMRVLDRFDHIAGFGVLARDATQNGRVEADVEGHIVVRYDLAPADMERLHRGMVYTGEMLWAAGARELYPVYVGGKPVRNQADWKAFREARIAPSQMMLTAYHPLGTARMGRDPRTSVVGLDHQAHDVPGLYIVDGSTVPTSLGVNPQITIMAMATRAAGLLATALGAAA